MEIAVPLIALGGMYVISNQRNEALQIFQIHSLWAKMPHPKFGFFQGSRCPNMELISDHICLYQMLHQQLRPCNMWRQTHACSSFE